MHLNVYNDNGSINSYEINKNNFMDNDFQGVVSYISSSSKEETALNIFKSYFNKSKSILFDNSNKILTKKIDDFGIEKFNTKSKTSTIFDNKNFSFIYFTSGTTGNSVAALKEDTHIIEEVKVLSKLLNRYNIKKVVVTVPFIHIYGSLVGLFYPYFNDIDIVIKEHFLPNDLLNLIDDNTLVVTTPLYIKALNKIDTKKDLSKSIFLSSTGPLLKEDSDFFNKKFNSDIIQLFGSTETGGIAYTFNSDDFWTPLDNVEISTNDINELKIKSPFVSNIVYENDFKNINGSLQTFDYVEIFNNKFKLLGRSSQILKIAGKRYSTIQIENILENEIGIEKAIAFVKNDNKSLKDELLDITIETKFDYKKKDIESVLKNKLSNLKFSIDLTIVDKIEVSSVGKKMRVIK